MYHINIKNQAPVDTKSIVFDYSGDIQQYIKSCSIKKRAVINALLLLSHKFKKIYATQTQIAQLAGVTREYCNRILAELHEDGVLWKVGRHFSSCLYKVPACLFKYQKQLSYFLPALGIFSVSMLFPKADHTRYLNLFKLHRHNTDTDTHNTDTITRVARESVPEVDKEALKKTESKKGVVMSGVKSAGECPAIPEILSRLESVELTEAGKVWLSGFDQRAIKAGDMALCRKAAVSDHFRYLFAVAKKYSEENGLKVDWVKRSTIAMEFEITDDMPMIARVKSKSEYKSTGKTNGKTSADNFAEHKPKPEPQKLYSPDLMEDYLTKFRSVDGYRDNDAMVGKKGWDHKLAYAAAREAWWKEKEFNATKANELERWENCLTPAVEQALEKADTGMTAGSKDFLLSYRTNAINQLREEIGLPESVPVTVMTSQRINDTKTTDPTTPTKHLCEIGCGCDGWTWDEKPDYSKDGGYEEVY